MNKQSDTDLKTFLQRYRPTAPEAPPYEFNTIMAKIDANERKHHHRFSFWWRFAIPVTVAASLTLLIVSDFHNKQTTQVTSADDAALESFMYESYAVVDNGNSDLNVGDDWLQLAM